MIENYDHWNTNFLQEGKSNSMVLVDAKLQVGSFQIKLIRPRLLRVKGSAGEMKTRIISRGQCTTQRCETD